MATTQKKSGSRSASASAGGKANSSSKAKSGGKGKPAPPAPRPYRREVGAVVCLLLAVFAAIGADKDPNTANSGANWKEQAVLSAKTYTSLGPVPRESLLFMLQQAEGFTYEEAVYGADHSGQ